MPLLWKTTTAGTQVELRVDETSSSRPWAPQVTRPPGPTLDGWKRSVARSLEAATAEATVGPGGEPPAPLADTCSANRESSIGTVSPGFQQRQQRVAIVGPGGGALRPATAAARRAQTAARAMAAGPPRRCMLSRYLADYVRRRGVLVGGYGPLAAAWQGRNNVKWRLAVSRK